MNSDLIILTCTSEAFFNKKVYINKKVGGIVFWNQTAETLKPSQTIHKTNHKHVINLS